MALNHNLKVEPYEYQQEGITFGLEKRCLLIGDEPGLGKTLQSIGIVDTANAYPCLVICPSSLKINWQREFEKFTDKSALVLDNSVATTWPYLLQMGMQQVAIVNYESLRKYFVWDVLAKPRQPFRLKDVVFNPHIQLFKSVIIDESHRCLEYNSQVLTKEYGYMKIGDIVEKNLTNIHVASYDFKLKNVTFERILKTHKYATDKKLYRINFSGRNIITTEDHKVFTDRCGWKDAAHLQSGETVYLLRKDFSNSKNRKGDCAMLLEKLRLKNITKPTGSKSKSHCKSQTKGSSQVRMVWPRFCRQAQQKQAKQKSFLFSELFGKMASKTARNNCSKQFGSEETKVTIVGKKTNGRPQNTPSAFDKNEREKSDVLRIRYREDASSKKRSTNKKPWWKWTYLCLSRFAENLIRPLRGLLGICSKNKIRERAIREPGPLLQNRHCNTGENDSYRSRWLFSFRENSKRKRPKEGFDIECVRVDSVEIYQCPSENTIGLGVQHNSFVYDIEVERVHNYFANDLLVHNCKDPSAQQTIFTKGITEGKDWRILLSGTPVVNRPADLVAQLSIMGRLSEFGGKSKFLADYGGGEQTKDRNKDIDTPRNLDRLSAELYDRCMIRREKSKVLTQLPDKTRIDLFVDISNRDEYELAAQDLASYLREYTECTDREIKRKMRMEALVKFMTLRSLASKGKVKQAIDFVKTFLANGKPLILFCSLHEIVDELKKAFPDAVSVTGRDSMQAKQSAVDAFQSGSAKLIICSIKAAGVGLTLTASSNVAFCEFAWTYADCCQCEDRAHRIGQKDNVTCYYLIGRHTIDGALYNIIHKKKSIAQQIMGTDDEIPTDEMYFDQLTDMFLNPNDHD